MESFVNIRAFTYPHEASLAGGLLDSEGIEYFLKDEMTVQVINIYSNAVGGVKLQVRQDDVDAAIEILLKAGYIKEADLKPDDFFSKMNERTYKIPLLNKVRVEVRLMILVAIPILIIALLAFIF